jgi:sulfur carrier protein ThiS
MITVEVHLSFIPAAIDASAGPGNGSIQAMRIPRGSTVAAVATHLGLETVGLIFLINGSVGRPDSELSDGDCLSVLPSISGG